jgi:cleavage and polyadenylation specificity factor subunit 2
LSSFPQEATGGEEEVVLNEQALEAEDLSEGKGIIRGRNGRPPIKVSTVPRRLEVLAEISYVPLEGRVSSSVARQTVRALQPRQLVVLGSSDTDDSSNAVDEVKLLVEAARSYIVGSRVVVAPSDGETAELNVGHAAFSARLIDTPYLTAEEREARGEDAEPLAPIEPFEAQLGECTVSLFDGTATGRKVALDGSLVLAPRAMSGKMAQRPIYISNGDVLLTDLRSELIAQGMKADYSTRVGFAQLVVNGKVIVKKEQDSGKINVEGPLCEDFFTVQAVVRGQYATL